MLLDYVVTNPTGNITVLVKTVPTEENRQDMIHKAFELEQSCEQVGFISSVSDRCIKLEMMGYEFCGNATISSACYQAYTNGLEAGADDIIQVISSGIDYPLDVEVHRNPAVDDESGQMIPSFTATLKVEEPEIEIFEEWPVIHLDGISHMLVPVEDMSIGKAQAHIKEYASEFSSPAFGIILYTQTSNSEVEIKPLVFVKESDTLVWEHGCASGSTAMGYYLHELSMTDSITIKQPGGTMHLDIREDGLYLTGNVMLK